MALYPKMADLQKPRGWPLLDQWMSHSVHYDGVTGYGDCGNAVTLQPAAITVEILYRCLALPTQGLACKFDWTSVRGWQLLSYTNHIGWRVGDGVGTVDVNSAIIWENNSPGRWIHVAGTNDGVNSYLITNGHVAGPAAVAYLPNLTRDLGVGVYSSPPDPPWGFSNILVAAFRLYDRVLSLAELNYNRRNPLNPIRVGLMLWLAHLEGRGGTVADLSGNGNNATLNGGYTWYDMKKYEGQIYIS